MSDTRNVYQRMLAAMAEVRYVQKQKGKEGGLKFSIVSHDVVTAVCRDALMKSGVYAYPMITSREFATFKMKRWQNGQEVEVEYAALTVALEMNFFNADNPTEYFVVNSIGIGVDALAQQDKCPGKAISYAVKYAYLKALALETGDEAESDFEQTCGDERTPQAPAPIPNTLTVADVQAALTPPALSSPAREALQPVDKNAAMLNTCTDALAAEFKMDIKQVRKECKQLLKGKYEGKAVKDFTFAEIDEALGYLWAVFRDANTPEGRDA